MGQLLSRVGTDKYFDSYDKTLQRLKDDAERLHVRLVSSPSFLPSSTSPTSPHHHHPISHFPPSLHRTAAPPNLSCGNMSEIASGPPF